MKNKLDKKEQSVEYNSLYENIDTVDSSSLYSMNENTNFQSNIVDPYYDAPSCPLMERCYSSNNLYDEPTIQRKRPNSNYHATTPYSNHIESQQPFYPIESPYNYYENYPPYYNSPYQYFMPFLYQLDEYDEY